jgi:hypothetical protein
VTEPLRRPSAASAEPFPPSTVAAVLAIEAVTILALWAFARYFGG